jgi:hypothetical protein
MPGNARDMIFSAERRFPVRIRIGVPPGGFGQRYAEITAWLDENCGADGWAMTPSGMRGVLNDAVSIYFLDATLASAFVALWCAGYKIERAEACSGSGRMSRRRGPRRICTERRSVRPESSHQESLFRRPRLAMKLSAAHQPAGRCRRSATARAGSESGQPNIV